MEDTKKKVELSTEAIRDKIMDNLAASGWNTVLRYWLEDDAFIEIIDTLKQHTKEGRRWVPGIKNMLRFLRETPYDKVKAVIITDEVSNMLEYNTGIPLSIDPVTRDGVPVKLKASQVAENMLWSLGMPPEERNYDMTRYTKQGLLMIPLAPTARIDGVAHYKLWHSTILRIIEQINKLGNIPVILLGPQTLQYQDYLTTEYTRYIRAMKWIDMDWWKWTNEIIKQNGQKGIKWK